MSNEHHHQHAPDSDKGLLVAEGLILLLRWFIQGMLCPYIFL